VQGRKHGTKQTKHPPCMASRHSCFSCSVGNGFLLCAVFSACCATSDETDRMPCHLAISSALLLTCEEKVLGSTW
jgi:hypothetical protein